MNFKYRYGLLLLLLVAVLASFIIFDPYGLHRSSGRKSSSVHHKSLRLHSIYSKKNFSQKSFLDSYESSIISEDSRLFSVLSSKGIEGKSRILRANIPAAEDIVSTKKQIRPSGHICRMHNCFDHSICQKNGFKVFIYPASPSDPTVSGKYKEILDSIKRSRYYTEDPEQACLFVLSLDTLDRDPLSSEYVSGLGTRLEQLKLWKGGANHLVFNLYSGTWPDYSENDIGFDMGIAMLAKSSISQQHFRPGFDISFPLFHKEHSFNGGERGYLQATGTLSGYRHYALVFKGKRYLSGIGSETRNSLYHVNNNRDIMLLTTCKHGKDWKNLEDERCETDNKEYDKWDYKVLLKNSTFCLVPRGRRLGSYRFLEALQAGCIPVVLSNDWMLPFSEVIDWKKAVIWADERLLLQLPTIVRSVDMETILSLRQQTQFLWDTYFSSIDKIVATTLEIVKGRLTSSDVWSPASLVWNSSPGGLVFMPEYSQSLSHYPFYLESFNDGWNPFLFSSTLSSNHLKVKKLKFDAMIWATNASLPLHSLHSPLHKIFKTLVKCHSLRKIFVLWQLDEPLLPDFKWIHMSVPVVHKKIQQKDGEKYLFHEDFADGQNGVSVDAVLNMDENSLLNADEIEFGFHVWTNFQHRLVGFVARSHFWHDAKQSWHYTSKPTPDFSLILTTPAFYHRYYNYLYKKVIPPFLQQMASSCDLCHDVIMNCLISHVTKLPPIKIGQRRSTASTGNQTASLVRQPLNRDSLPEGNYVNEIVNVNNENNILKNRNDQLSSLYEVLHKQLNQQRPNKEEVNVSEVSDIGLTTDMEVSHDQYQQTAESVLISRFVRAHRCLSAISDYFGYMPLIKSILRFDPLLFKDPVSVVRKKYPGVDKVT